MREEAVAGAVMIKIPRYLLNASATYYQASDVQDGYGNKEVIAPIALDKMWITTKSKFVTVRDTNVYDSVTLLFFDVIKSTPAGHKFRIGDHILYEDLWYLIISVHPSKGPKLHHYEVELRAVPNPNV